LKIEDFDEITNVPYIEVDNKIPKRYLKNFGKKSNNFIFQNIDEEKYIIKIIDEIVKVFTQHFSNLKFEEIFEGLKKNSFDIWDTYLYLTSPKDFMSNYNYFNSINDIYFIFLKFKK